MAAITQLLAGTMFYIELANLNVNVRNPLAGFMFSITRFALQSEPPESLPFTSRRQTAVRDCVEGVVKIRSPSNDARMCVLPVCQALESDGCCRH